MNTQDREDRIINLTIDRYNLDDDRAQLINEIEGCQSLEAIDYYMTINDEVTAARLDLECELVSLKALQEMVEAYGTFVNNGKHTKPYFITRIEDKDGYIIWEQPKPKSEQILSLATSQMMIEMLKNVVNSGTAIRLRNTYNLTNDIAGKTGTTQSNADSIVVICTL